MYAFSQSEYDTAIEKLTTLLTAEPAHFDAQLALGMCHYRKGDFPAAIREGCKAEQLKPDEQLVHTNLSLFHMKAGNHQLAESYGLKAKLAAWREEARRAKISEQQTPIKTDPELQIAGNKPQPMKFTGKFPEQPWKKKTTN